MGAPSHPVPATSDPLATRVLSRGDAIAAPAGRADDFSWPRAGANAAPDAAAEPIVPTPPAPPAKGSGGKNDSSKGDVNKNTANKIDAKKSGDAKAQLAVPPAAPPPRPQNRAVHAKTSTARRGRRCRSLRARIRIARPNAKLLVAGTAARESRCCEPRRCGHEA